MRLGGGSLRIYEAGGVASLQAVAQKVFVKSAKSENGAGRPTSYLLT